MRLPLRQSYSRIEMLVEALLALAPRERCARMTALAHRQPALAARVRELITADAQLDADGFMGAELQADEIVHAPALEHLREGLRDALTARAQRGSPDDRTDLPKPFPNKTR
ncbi:MAG: hypothetical protein AAFX85_10595 [Pseudomonadota bacterium]